MEIFIENFNWSVNPEPKTLTIRPMHKHLDKTNYKREMVIRHFMEYFLF